MRNKEIRIAAQFGMTEKVQAFEKALLAIDGIAGDHVSMGLDGFFDNIRQVIIVPHYDIPMQGFYENLRALKQSIVSVAVQFGLYLSGDAIEDYGEHLYFVFNCDGSWPYT